MKQNASHRYMTTRERKRKKMIDLVFIAIATVALAVQIFVLFQYFETNAKKKEITEKYNVQMGNGNCRLQFGLQRKNRAGKCRPRACLGSGKR